MIKILKAFYGTEDVTEIIIKNYFKNNVINFSVSNDVFGDPSPGGNKIFNIELEFNGENKKYTLYEGQVFLYPEEDYEIERKINLMLTDREKLIKNFNLEGIGIEIGVQQGNFSKVILENSNLHLILVDSWRHIEGAYFEAANTTNEHHLLMLNDTLKKLTPKFENRFTLIRELSENIVNFFKDDLFNFIYLDADHSEDFVYNELKRWWPKLKKNGIIAGHDYVNRDTAFGVKKAVDKFFLEKNLKVNICDTGCCPTWFVTKNN